MSPSSWGPRLLFLFFSKEFKTGAFKCAEPITDKLYFVWTQCPSAQVQRGGDDRGYHGRLAIMGLLDRVATEGVHGGMDDEIITLSVLGQSALGSCRLFGFIIKSAGIQSMRTAAGDSA